MRELISVDAVLGETIRKYVRVRGELRHGHYADAQARHMRARGGSSFLASHAVAMFVQAGRWVGLCACGAGMTTDRSWPDVRCFECGAVAAPLWPGDADAIERLLIARPRDVNRNWLLGEPLGALVADNIEHGLVELR